MDSDRSDAFLGLGLQPPDSDPSGFAHHVRKRTDLEGVLPVELETIKEESLDMSELDMMPGGSYPGMSCNPGQSSIKAEKEKGTFWPEKPKVDAAAVKASTVLTNLQRGNIPTILRTLVEPVVQTIHQRAGQGELRFSELEVKGALVDERDHLGKTPLMWSAAYGQTPTLKLLLGYGAVSRHFLSQRKYLLLPPMQKKMCPVKPELFPEYLMSIF